MDEGGYKIRNQEAIHFVTFAVVEWIDEFTRKDYRDIVLGSIKHCQEKKGLLLHCWCIMSNHLHLIASAKNQDLRGILRDFKKIPVSKSLKQLKKIKEKAERSGCFVYLDKRVRKIAGIKITSFGVRITSHRNYTVQHLFFRR